MNETHQFRNYALTQLCCEPSVTQQNHEPLVTKAENTYKKMYENQTPEYVLHQEVYTQNPFFERDLTISEILEILDNVVDESDPDTNLPQSIHAFQTAQAMHDILHENNFVHITGIFSKEEYKMLPPRVKNLYELTYGNLIENLIPVNNKCVQEQFIAIALIHDFGKILCVNLPSQRPSFAVSLWRPMQYPQWSVVGDTFIIGLELPTHAPYQHKHYHTKNNQIINYEESCGFEKMLFSFGHDEFLAKVLERSNTTILNELIYIVRYHSFYSWHSPPEGTQRAHEMYASDRDWKMLPLLKLFQKCDLYSKKNNEKIESNFINMAEKYIQTFKI